MSFQALPENIQRRYPDASNIREVLAKNMTEPQRDFVLDSYLEQHAGAIRALGWAVAVMSPEKLRGADRKQVQQHMQQAGSDLSKAIIGERVVRPGLLRNVLADVDDGHFEAMKHVNAIQEAGAADVGASVEGDEKQDVLAELIADVHHWCDAKKVEPSKVLDLAQEYYTAEADPNANAMPPRMTM